MKKDGTLQRAAAKSPMFSIIIPAIILFRQEHKVLIEMQKCYFTITVAVIPQLALEIINNFISSFVSTTNSSYNFQLNDSVNHYIHHVNCCSILEIHWFTITKGHHNYVVTFCDVFSQTISTHSLQFSLPESMDAPYYINTLLCATILHL